MPCAVRPRYGQTEQVCWCWLCVYVFGLQRVRGAGDFPLAALSSTPGSICWGWLPKTRVAVGSLVLTIQGPTVRSLPPNGAGAAPQHPILDRTECGLRPALGEPENSCPQIVCCVCFPPVAIRASQ